MNKQEFIKAINGKLEGVTLTQTEEQLNATLEVIEEAIASGDKIQLVGYLTIENRYVKAKEEKFGTNPQDPTGDKIVHKAQPEKMTPSVKLGKKLKDAALRAPIVVK